ncbi:unnamed protein product [Rotaria sordida]|uniref:Uncharacterized protein n=1 Tax=Rotaria sordida TaxID=392033 RepID=A0A815VGU4_9BILA|nr:unnamed protein product [Rotaria sordida]CAF1530038.1 unnamed protein product [Rotaria sordida]CAF3833125.1 unnamed protein product [Rotaria sordida]CAF4025936.1 unnamed protein product [Rotaria sordida]
MDKENKEIANHKQPNTDTEQLLLLANDLINAFHQPQLLLKNESEQRSLTEEKLAVTENSLIVAAKELVETKHTLSGTKQELTETKQTLSATKQELTETKHALSAIDHKLFIAEQNLLLVNVELNLMKQKFLKLEMPMNDKEYTQANQSYNNMKSIKSMFYPLIVILPIMAIVFLVKQMLV